MLPASICYADGLKMDWAVTLQHSLHISPNPGGMHSHLL